MSEGPRPPLNPASTPTPTLARTPTPEELSRLFDTVVGAVTLRVSDLERQADFYAQAIGLRRSQGQSAVELNSAAGETLLMLDDGRSAGSTPASQPHTGLFHVAYRYPDRATLAAAVKRTAEIAPLFEGASDHGVSEAVYFRDPEGNGIELYRDRSYEEWPAADPGRVAMYTQPLDLAALVAEAAGDNSPSVDVGHIHLQISDVGSALAFWGDLVGLDERQRFGPQAIFMAEGLYHHHIGANTWHSAGAEPISADRPGLDGFELRLRSQAAVDGAAARLERAGIMLAIEGATITATDPDGNRITLRPR